MTVFLAILFLSLNVGRSGGAIKPVLTFTPNWGNILYYDSVTLTCNVSSTEDPRTYHWYKDNQPIPGEQQSLRIFGTSVHRDSGHYQCQTIGGGISDPVFLNVTDEPVILQRPPSAIYEGDPLTLRCHHGVIYGSVNTNFYKDDREIKSSDSDSTFHIPKIMMSDSGLYKCTKKLHRNDVANVFVQSDVSFISVKGREVYVTVIAVTIVGVLLIMVLSAVLIWRYKHRKGSSASCQVSPQETAALGNSIAPNCP